MSLIYFPIGGSMYYNLLELDIKSSIEHRIRSSGAWKVISIVIPFIRYEETITGFWKDDTLYVRDPVTEAPGVLWVAIKGTREQWNKLGAAKGVPLTTEQEQYFLEGLKAHDLLEVGLCLPDNYPNHFKKIGNAVKILCLNDWCYNYCPIFYQWGWYRTDSRVIDLLEKSYFEQGGKLDLHLFCKIFRRDILSIDGIPQVVQLELVKIVPKGTYVDNINLSLVTPNNPVWEITGRNGDTWFISDTEGHESLIDEAGFKYWVR